MYKKIAVLFFSVFLTINAFSTIFDNTQPSPRAIGMGGALTAYNAGVEGVFYNPATLFSLNKNELFLGYKRPYSFSFINESNFAIGRNLGKVGKVAFGYKGFTVGESGDNLESEQTMILSYANSFYSNRDATFNMGVNIKYLSLSFEGYGKSSNLSLDFGILAKVGKHTLLGFSLKDFNAPQFGSADTINIPTKMNFAVSYAPYYGTLTTIEIEKNEFDPARIHAGGEFNIFKILTLRFGIATMPTTVNTGFTISYWILSLDYGMEYHDILGYTHNFALRIKF